MHERDDVYVYLRDDLPPKTHELVSPNADGSYTVLIDARLNYSMRLDAYNHALEHIDNGDFDVDNVDSVDNVELKAHGIPGEIFKRETNKRIRRLSAKIRFMEKIGYDFFSAAEEKWLSNE